MATFGSEQAAVFVCQQVEANSVLLPLHSSKGLQLSPSYCNYLPLTEAILLHVCKTILVDILSLEGVGGNKHSHAHVMHT